MFEKIMATAVLPAADIARAKQWWHDVLGRDPVMEDGESMFYEIGGVVVMVYRTDYAGTAQNTAFNLFTDDLDRDMTAMRTQGVVFNDYDLPGLTTVDGVADLDGERAAWFTDSEGNIFALGEMSPDRSEQAARLRAAMTGRA